MSEHDQIVGRFYRRMAAWYILRDSVAAVTLCLFLWGTVVLALRATQGTSAEWLLWGAAALPVAIGIAARVAIRRLPDRSAVRAALDRIGGCGGLLMAGAERDLGQWDRTMPALGLPRIHWQAGRPLGLLGVAVGYLVLGFLLPSFVNAQVSESTLDVTREADRLAEQVRVLKEEKIIEPKRAESLAEKLEDVRSRAAGKEPGKTLELLDHLNDTVHRSAQAAAESSARKSTQLDQIEAGAEGLREAAPTLDAKATAALMAELSALAQKAAAETEQLGEELDSDLAAALANGKLSSDQLAKLASAAKAGKGSIKKTAQKLYDAKLIDADQLKECQGGKCDSKGLAEFLKKNGSKNGLCEAMCNLPGRGGVTEGPGAAELQFGDRSSENGMKFREEALPPSQAAALKESQTTGVSSSAPRHDPKAGPAAAGALAGAAAGGGSVNAGTVLPQHRAAVARYFDRPAK